MSLLKTLFSCALLFCSCIVLPVAADTFVEENGLLLMEAESSSARGSWSLQRSIGGYSGSGYLLWTGPDLFSVRNAGRDAITYRFRIQKAGNYQFRWRSRITKGSSSSEHNDSWVRFPSGRNVSGEHALNGWTKVYMNVRNNWSWRSATVDHVGKPIRRYFAAGDHTVQISGRSNGHAIDRLALYRYGDVGFSESKFNSLGSSGTTSGGSPPAPAPKPEPAPAPAPAPKPEPAPAPAPAPAPKPEPAPAPEPKPAPAPSVEAAPETAADIIVARTDAPGVTVDGLVLSWQAVDSVSINVHRGNGEWLESLAGSSTQWLAPAAGSYYVVATNNESWPNWGRSDTVDATRTDDPADDAGRAGSLGLSVQVYSSSAVELFWQSNDLVDASFEVRRNGTLLSISDWRSYFDTLLESGTRYDYSVSAFNAAGDIVDTQSVAVTTLADPSGSTAGGSTAESSATTANTIAITGNTYSQSALEIFWDIEALPANGNYRFEIYQNGELVMQGDQRSYFIEDLQSATEYQFSVTAVDTSGNIFNSPALVLSTLRPDTP